MMLYFSSFDMSYLLLPFVGFLVGLFGSMLGGGGGFFFLPVLTLIFHVSAQSAVFTSLLAALPICLFGSLGHLAKGNIDTKTGIRFAITGLIGAIGGTMLIDFITEQQIKTAFGIYVLFLSMSMLFSEVKLFRKSIRSSKKKPVNKFSGNAASIYALSAGIVTGGFGTSGAAPILAGLMKLQLPVKTVIGTSLLIVLTNSLFAIGTHILTGTADLTIVGFLTLGSAIGALNGSRALSNIHLGMREVYVRYIYSITLAIVGILMLTTKR